MTKWVCSLCGHVYDPEKESPPPEAAGAARCGYAGETKEAAAGTLTCRQCGSLLKATAVKEEQ